METLWLAVGTAVVTALALVRLREMLRWVPAEARFLGAEAPEAGGSRMGQPMPIAFRLPDGTEARAALRHYGRGDLPRVGARLRIRHHPADPGRVEWAAAVPLLALLCAALLCLLAVLLRRALQAQGLMA